MAEVAVKRLTDKFASASPAGVGVGVGVLIKQPVLRERNSDIHPRGPDSPGRRLAPSDSRPASRALNSRNVEPGGPESMTGGEAATYRRLRAHLDILKLAAAAALTPVLDAARDQDLSLISAMERLLATRSPPPTHAVTPGLLRFASLPAHYGIEDFDVAAQPGVDEKLVRELALLRFLDAAGNVLLIGPPVIQRELTRPLLRRRRAC